MRRRVFNSSNHKFSFGHFTLNSSTASLAILVASLALAAPMARAEEATTNLEEVVVSGERADGPVKGYVAKRSKTGTKTATPLAETPQSVSVVPKEQIEDQGAQSVAEAMRYSAGVFAEYRGASNLHDEMFLRGYYYTPRYLDGLLYGNGSLGQIDPYMLERVEVIRGPASVLYGQANPGGMVNLVSKRPSDARIREIMLGIGTDGKREVGFDVGDRVAGRDDLFFRFTGTAGMGDTQEGIETKRLALSPSLLWRPDADTSLLLQAYYQREPNAGYRNFLEAQGTVYATSYGYIPRNFLLGDPAFNSYERTQAYAGYQFEHRFDETFTARQNLRYSVIDTSMKSLVEWSMPSETTFTRKAGAGPERLDTFTVDNQLEANFDTGFLKHKVLGGLDYRWSKRDYEWGYASNTSTIDWTSPSYGDPGDTDIIVSTDTVTKANQLGAYLQDQIKLGNLNISAGIRHDWATTDIDDQLAGTQTSYDDRAFTWRAGAIYNFDNGISPYVSYSTSFEPTLEAPATGQSPFEPTTGQQFEVGVKYAPAGANYQLIASWYHLTQQNVLTRATWSDPYTQIGEIESKGFELEGHAQLTAALSVVAAFSHIDQTVTKALDGTEGKTPARVPENQASFWAKYAFQEGERFAGLSLGGGVRYIGESWGNSANTFQVADVTLIDAMASYDFGAAGFAELKNVKLQLNATNLFDKTYVASCNSAYACWYGSGRTVTAQMKINF